MPTVRPKTETICLNCRWQGTSEKTAREHSRKPSRRGYKHMVEVWRNNPNGSFLLMVVTGGRKARV